MHSLLAQAIEIYQINIYWFLPFRFFRYAVDGGYVRDVNGKSFDPDINFRHSKEFCFDETDLTSLQPASVSAKSMQ